MLMSLERCPQWFAGLGIPQPDGLVLRPRHDVLAIGRECNRKDIMLMSLERCPQWFAGLGIPQPDGLVLRPRHDALAIRRECSRRDPMTMPAQHTLNCWPGRVVPRNNAQHRRKCISELFEDPRLLR